MTRQFNLEHTECKLSTKGIEFSTYGASNFISFSTIVDVQLCWKKSPHILLNLKNSDFPDIELFTEGGTDKVENSSSKAMFISICKTILENTDLKISYQVYPKYIGDLVRWTHYLLIVVISILGIYASFFLVTGPNRSLYVWFMVTVVLFYSYKKIEMKKFGKQVLDKDNIGELDIFLTRKIFTRKIGSFEDFMFKSRT